MSPLLIVIYTVFLVVMLHSAKWKRHLWAGTTPSQRFNGAACHIKANLGCKTWRSTNAWREPQHYNRQYLAVFISTFLQQNGEIWDSLMYILMLPSTLIKISHIHVSKCVWPRYFISNAALDTWFSIKAGGHEGNMSDSSKHQHLQVGRPLVITIRTHGLAELTFIYPSFE